MSKKPTYEELKQKITDMEEETVERKRVEERLEEREQTLRALLNAPTETAILVDLEGTILALNEIAAQRIGKNADELVGLGIFDYLPPDMAVSRKTKGSEVTRSGKPVRFEDERAGRIYDNNIYPVFDAEKEVRALAIYARDITETIQVEESLQESEAKFQALADCSPIAISILRGEQYLYVNSVWKDLMGYSEEEALSLNPLMVVHPDMRELVHKRSVDRMSGEKVPPRYEMKVITKSGDVRWMDFSATVIEYDSKPAILNVANDITERKQMEEALQVSERRYRSIVEDQTEFIVRWLPDGTRTFANKAYCDYFGLTQDECIGISFFPLISEKDRKAVKKRIELLTPSNPVSTGEHRVIRPDGTIGWNQWVDRAIFDDEGQVIEFQSVGRDITEPKRTEETLRKLVETTSSQFGKAFFDSMAVHLSKAIGADYTLIGELHEGKSESIRTIAVAIDGDLADNFEYELANTPCENVVGKEVCSYASGVWDLFPEDVLLKEMGVEGYVGVPLFDSQHSALGIMVALFRQPLTSTDFVESVLQIFSSRTGSELERLRVDDALRQSEENYRSLFENTGTATFVAEEDMTVSQVNAKCEELSGYSRDEIVGKMKTTDFIPVEELERIKKYHFERRKKDADIPPEYELKLTDKNGNIKNVFIQVGLIPKTEQSIASIIDITPLKQAEKALRDSEEKYRELANSLPQYVFEMDENAVITFANRNAFDFFGYTQNDFDKGVNALQMLIPEDQDRAMENMRRRLSGEELGSSEYIAQKKDGTTFHAVVHVNPIIRENKPVGLRGIMVDITDRKLAEEEKRNLEKQLVQAQKMESIGTLAGGIAHDFNNILASIIGCTELSLEDAPKDTFLYENLREVLRAGMRAKDLVQQILTFSRQADQELKPLRVQTIIKEVLKLTSSTLPSTIEIKQYISNKCGLIMADSTQIHQIAMNLITNAYHAMEDEGGKLEVTLKEVELGADDLKDSSITPGTYVCLTVADTGIGMEQSALDLIFDPYFTTKEKDKGTGLGLVVVHGIVKSYRGKIIVYSEKGHGTVFHVYLPVIRTQVETEESVAITHIQRGDERILLVDDDEPIVRMEKQMLERLGYHVTARTSSIEVLEAFKAAPNKFDLVITDMTMPNMTGVQLSKKLLEIRHDIPIIICTGFSTKVDGEKTKAAGIRGYVMKPVVMSELAKKIREVLDKD